MTATRGIDYSWSRPPPAAIRSAGYGFAVRYLDYSAKGIDRAEAHALAAQQIWICCVYETGGTWMLGGYNAGVTAARDALQLGRAAGMPAGRPVYFGADFDADSGQASAVLDCLDGASQVLGKAATGVYGGLLAVRAALDAGYKWAYQTIAWSGGVWDPRAQIRQTGINGVIDGNAVDFDVAVTADYGQWMPGIVPGKDAPPKPRLLEEPVLLSPKGVPLPVAIPDGTRALRFIAAGTADIQVHFHSETASRSLALAWASGSQEAPVPANCHAAKITRVDAGPDPVSVAFTS